jgi:AAA domain
MLGTASLHRLASLADQQAWRLALVGDPCQLQAVGRGDLFAELCANGRVHERTASSYARCEGCGQRSSRAGLIGLGSRRLGSGCAPRCRYGSASLVA